jgi:hypothetical protein
MAMVARKIVPSSSVVCADLNDEVVLLNVDTGIYFGLDGLGAQIWNLVGEGLDEDEIHSRLLSEYEVTAEQLGADLAEFVTQLEAHGLIEPNQG